MVSNDSVKYLKHLFLQVLKSKHFRNTSELVVTDIHIQPVSEENVVNVYDDDDTLIVSERCEWLSELNKENFYDDFLKLAQETICVLKEEGAFNDVNILQPFSFVLIDENKETLSEIDIVDSDTILLNDELLKGWEEEMDSFIDTLLKN